MATKKAKVANVVSRRVWIELEVPADEVQAKEIGRLATNMLQRLNAPEKTDYSFWWSDREQRWCFGGDWGYKVLSDHGEWFNLDYFGRDLEVTV